MLERQNVSHSNRNIAERVWEHMARAVIGSGSYPDEETQIRTLMEWLRHGKEQGYELEVGV